MRWRAAVEVVRELLQARRHGARADRLSWRPYRQTVRHRAPDVRRHGHTLQLNSPALLAEPSEVAVVGRLPVQPRRKPLAARARRCPPSTRACSAGPAQMLCSTRRMANPVLAGDISTVLGFDRGVSAMR
ncbi:Vitamin D3 receptor [Manis javanica]|nr:Vitamin D3 receptor [Manis javanica]